MVFFTCSSCGESLKKNQVDKHYQFRCRNCEYLTCMDCNQEFWGNDFLKHTKCISEDQKYGGKDFVPKPNSNKGEVKQGSWIEHVKHTIATTQVPNYIARLMEQLIHFENIPRKKTKFENFAKNSLKTRDDKVIQQVWALFEKSHEAAKDQKATNSNTSQKEEQQSTSDDVNSSPRPKKKRKHETNESGSELKNGNNHIEEQQFETADGNPKIKFKWTKTIKNILRQSPEKLLSIKKLRKKVIKEYVAAMGSDDLLEKEELKNKFERKLTKCSQVEIIEDQITLKE